MRTRTLAIAAAALVAAACTGKGKVKEPTELTALPETRIAGDVVWDESPGEGSRRFLTGLRLDVEADALFVADIEGQVFALDPASGATRWRTNTKARVVAGPAAVGDLVVVGTLDAEVIALARADGKERWRATMSSEVMAPPAGAGEVIVVKTVDGRVQGLSAENGQRLWSFDRSVPALSLRGLSAPVIVGGRVASGMDNGRVAMLRLNDGKPVWEQVVAVPSGRSELERITDVDGDLMIEGDRLYAVSFGGELAAINLADGEVRWRRAIKSYHSLALLDELIVATDQDGIVWALDAATGAAVWKQEGLKYRRVSAPVAFAGHVVVADLEGYLHWLAKDDGRLVGRLRPVKEPLATPPVASGDLLYVQASDGRLAAVRARPAS